jgi:cytochrome b involved in lipid metabolism
MPTDTIDTDHTYSSAYDADLSHSSDPDQEPSKLLAREISRLQSLERGLVKKSSQSFTAVVEARQARKDARIRKCLAIVVGIGLLSGFAMAVLAVVKQMKGSNVQYVIGESGGDSPVTFLPEELQIQATPPENGHATDRPHDVQVSVEFIGELRKREKRELGSEDSSDSDSSDSEDQGALFNPPPPQGVVGTPPPPPPQGVRTISPQELAQHNTENDLWTELYGTVYDLTTFVGGHPGGMRVIVNIAGKNGLQAFESKHSQKTLQAFDRYIVGWAAPPAEGGPQVIVPPVMPRTPGPTPAPKAVATPEPRTARPTPAPTPRATARTISLQELAQHNAANDLWAELYGTVYDLTAFADSHPGGRGIIIGIAGKGGRLVFESFHSQKTVQKLDRYIVAPLK